MGKTKLKWLKAGAHIPVDIEPRRYTKHNGYVELRWRLSSELVVCAYEHRIEHGMVTTAARVHHKNHVRGDNRPENLVHCSASDHHEMHISHSEGSFCVFNQSGTCRCGCGQRAPIASRTDYARGWRRGKPLGYIQHHFRRGH